jgi:hypothetical protein
VKTNTNFCRKVNLDFGHAHKDIILLKSLASSRNKCVYMDNYPACLPEVLGHTKRDLGQAAHININLGKFESLKQPLFRRKFRGGGGQGVHIPKYFGGV